MQFLLLGLSSFGLGALHALEPGHGKTVVGAYLVGSKGRTVDAVALGIIVTLAHSGSVILLGILSTVAAAYFVPETVHKVLELVSGVLVLGVGFWMLGVRLRQARGQGHHHGHLHEHGAPGHQHGHAEHGHSHGAGAAPQAGERPGFGQLLALGTAGGVVPCPGALAVLLASASYGELTRGLLLVVLFSLGMATVLVAVGIAMVKAAGFAGRRLAENRWVHVMPVASAAIVTLIGAGLTVRAALDVL